MQPSLFAFAINMHFRKLCTGLDQLCVQRDLGGLQNA